MAELNGLPVFYIKCKESLESNQGVDFISLVDCPAIENNWITLAKEKKPMKFTTDSEKQLLAGPVLIPDQPIYRNDEANGEHYVIFTKEEIEKLNRKFHALQKSINLNFQHKENSKINQAVIQESWLTGKTDKSTDLGFTLPEGSWFICSHIGDSDFWKKEVKSGNVKGYSIEGFLDMEMKSQKKFSMNKKKFEAYKQADGGCDVFIDGPIAVDSYVFTNYPSVTLVDGKQQITQYPIWQDMIILEDGTILTLKDGKIIIVEKKATMKKQIFSITATAKDGTVIISTDSEFKVGSMVTTTDEKGASIPVKDGDYVFDNGDMFTVKDGAITVYTSSDDSDTELSIEEVSALKKALGFNEFEAQIKELRIKLKMDPAAPASTKLDDGKEPVTKTDPVTKLSAMDKIRKFTEASAKKNLNK